jgi:signal transduction histidine kinase
MGPSLDPRRDSAMLRIADEALHNALRHAHASRIVVRLDDHLIEVRDDGAGFDPSEARLRSTHLGLTSMEERARELGGRLEIISSKDKGTSVRLEVPD